MRHNPRRSSLALLRMNRPFLPNMKKNADGGVTLYIQKDSPGKDKQANWLPAPNDLIYVVMRLYRYEAGRW